MNSQELETAKRIGANITVVVWRDDGYGLIDWKQRNEFGRPFGVEFGNPDFVAYAESFGIAGFRVGVGGRPLPDPDARARRARPVARRGPDRLPREPPPDRAARRPGGRRVVGLPAHTDRSDRPSLRPGTENQEAATIVRRPSVPSPLIVPARLRLHPTKCPGGLVHVVLSPSLRRSRLGSAGLGRLADRGPRDRPPRGRPGGRGARRCPVPATSTSSTSPMPTAPAATTSPRTGTRASSGSTTAGGGGSCSTRPARPERDLPDPELQHGDPGLDDQ